MSFRNDREKGGGLSIPLESTLKRGKGPSLKEF